MPISTIGQNGLNAPITLTSPVINTVTSAASTALTLQSAGTTAVTIGTNQYVGIGTVSPVAPITIAGSSNTLSGIVFAPTAGGGNNWGLRNGYPAVSNGYFTIVNETSSTVAVTIDTSNNFLVKKSSAPASADNNVGAQLSATGKCIFEASGDRALILNRLSDNGIIQEFFRGAGNQVGNIQANTSSVAYNTSSDYRLKEDIAPMTGALAKVTQLKPVTYKWKSDGEEGQGFIAHELQAIVPDCVTGAKDAVDADGKPVYQGIDTSFLVATLTAAIQELKTIVDAQAAEIAELKAKVA